jgi:hypothetical protein
VRCQVRARLVKLIWMVSSKFQRGVDVQQPGGDPFVIINALQCAGAAAAMV